MFARYVASVRSRRVVDKYPELVFRIPYVRALFPDAKFLFIYRSGIDACQSIVKWSERLGFGAGENREDWWGRNDSKWRLFWDQLIESDKTYAAISALGSDAMDQSNRAALEWIVTMREGISQALVAPDSVVKIRYEDLLARPVPELTRLMSACGLEVDNDVDLTYAAESLHENAPKQLPALLPPVQQHFDETMALLGYASDS